MYMLMERCIIYVWALGLLRPSGHRLKQQTKLSGINMYLDPDLGLKINFTIHSKHKTENKFIYAHKIEEKNEN